MLGSPFSGRERRRFKVIDKKTGQVIERGQGPNNGINTWVEVVPGSNILITHHEYGVPSKTYSADDVTVEGDVHVSRAR